MIDRMAIEDALHAAEMATSRLDMDAIQDQVRMAVDQARVAADQARLAVWDARDWNNVSWDVQQSTYVYSGSNPEQSRYNEGLRMMDDHRYESAISSFDKAIAQKGSHADGALYHKAYCQARLGQSTEAAATLTELKKSYPQSAYLKDVKVLEADVKKLGPDQVDDEEIKILAIQSMQNQDPEKVIPLLETQLSKSTNSLKVKYQALYVLAGIDNPRAHTILLSYAKGAGNPELQRKAISYIGSRNQKTSAQELIDIYNSSSDVDVRLTVISAFSRAGAKSPLMSIASSGHLGPVNTTVFAPQAVTLLQSRAMNGLTELASPQEVWPLYQKEENKDLRLQWVGVFSAMNASDQLMQIAKTDKDPAVRNKAIRALGNAKSDKTGQTLLDIYNAGDKDARLAVISALGNQQNADSLVAIAKKETDPELKRQLVSKLADMAKTSKVAMDYLMDIIR
jgi:HEAT repeat protein